jgi:N-acetylneuraminic acid mutarotase
VPAGRDSHSSALIGNKIYIFGGQGDGDIIFDDLYCLQVTEEVQSNGELIFNADWK